MDLGDVERLVRVFTDALQTVDGRALFGGVVYSGVGVNREESGRCSLVRYADGLVVGPYTEASLASGQSFFVFDDETETLVEEHPDGFRFEGELFTGVGITPNRTAPEHVGSMSTYVDGRYANERLEWFPNGQLAAFDLHSHRVGEAQANRLFQWHENGTMALSQFSMEVEGSTRWASTDVQFDDDGRLELVSIDQWSHVVERMGDRRVRELAQGRVFLGFEELTEFRVGRTLRLGPMITSEEGFDFLFADGGMDDLEGIECDLSTARVRQLLDLPRLRRIHFYHAAPDHDSVQLLEEWEKAAPGRELILPG